MEPNWQMNQQPRQGSGGHRPSVWNDQGEYAQQPLGSQQRQLPYQGQGTQPQPFAGGQAWQGYPPQPSAAPTPSNPWATGPVDPFDEPSEAPELMEARSDHLYNKEDRFWDHVDGAQQTDRHARKKPRGKAEGHTLRWVILILAALKYHPQTKVCAIKALERVSRPGLRRYSSAADMPKVQNGLGIAIVSTPKGIMTDKKARQENVGGEVLCYIY